MDYFIAKYWFIILPAIGYIAWQVRLESKVKYNEKEINALKDDSKESVKDMNKKLDEMNDKLTELCISFAKFTGYMERCNEEKK